MSYNIGTPGPRRGLDRASRRGHALSDARGMLLLFVSLLLLPLASAATDQKADGIRVLLRYDDFTKTSNFALEDKLFHALGRMGVPILVGAVPFPGAPYPEISTTQLRKTIDLSPQKIALLRDLASTRQIEVALHGYSHNSNSASGMPASEFAGLSFDRQRQLLMLGKSAFEATLGVPVLSFIPPFNTYDQTTVRALERTGFSVLSADTRYELADAAIAFLPGSASPQKMKQAIRNALRKKAGTELIVVVMHNYDFVEDSEKPPPLRKNAPKLDTSTLLEDIQWAKQQPGVTFVSGDDLLREREDLSAARATANSSLHKSWVRLHALLPAALASPPADGVYMTASRADAIRSKEYLLTVAIYGSLLLVIYSLSRHLHQIMPLGSYRKTQEKLLLAVSVGVALHGYFNGFYLSAAMLLVSTAGWYAGLAVWCDSPWRRPMWAMSYMRRRIASMKV